MNPYDFLVFNTNDMSLATSTGATASQPTGDLLASIRKAKAEFDACHPKADAIDVYVVDTVVRERLLELCTVKVLDSALSRPGYFAGKPLYIVSSAREAWELLDRLSRQGIKAMVTAPSIRDIDRICSAINKSIIARIIGEPIITGAKV